MAEVVANNKHAKQCSTVFRVFLVFVVDGDRRGVSADACFLLNDVSCAACGVARASLKMDLILLQRRWGQCRSRFDVLDERAPWWCRPWAAHQRNHWIVRSEL